MESQSYRKYIYIYTIPGMIGIILQTEMNIAIFFIHP